jgi:peptide/nickel transport system ATP-binding protein/oligopeptide transport system ATP-binding protein
VNLLEIKNLKMDFGLGAGAVQAIDDVSLTISAGETVCPVGDMADRVAVMYAGQIVELSPARELLRRPLHPYTRALMNSVPKLRGDADRLSAIPGNVPRIGNFPPGCRFAPRCPIAKPECSEKIPELLEVELGRFVRCPFWKNE